jgi:hypothetical protein
MPDPLRRFLEEKPDNNGVLMYRSDSRLYGRFWGCGKTISGLHFETCYYQGIEYCIEQGLAVLEQVHQCISFHKLKSSKSPISALQEFERGLLLLHSCALNSVIYPDFSLQKLMHWCTRCSG